MANTKKKVKTVCYFKFKIYLDLTVAFWGLCLREVEALGPKNVPPGCLSWHYSLGQIPGTVWVPLGREPAGKSWPSSSAWHHATGEDLRVCCVSGCS